MKYDYFIAVGEQSEIEPGDLSLALFSHYVDEGYEIVSIAIERRFLRKPIARAVLRRPRETKIVAKPGKKA